MAVTRHLAFHWMVEDRLRKTYDKGLGIVKNKKQKIKLHKAKILLLLI